MASLTVRNIPKDVMERLRKAAEEERRSVNAQAVLWLEREAHRWMALEERADLLRRIDASREATRRRHGRSSNSVEIIRKMREERGKSWV